MIEVRLCANRQLVRILHLVSRIYLSFYVAHTTDVLCLITEETQAHYLIGDTQAHMYVCMYLC
jgi:hypothetical protein